MEEYFLKIVEKQACGLNALNTNVERNDIYSFNTFAIILMWCGLWLIGIIKKIATGYKDLRIDLVIESGWKGN
jgi:hypothetical protein